MKRSTFLLKFDRITPKRQTRILRGLGFSKKVPTACPFFVVGTAKPINHIRELVRSLMHQDEMITLNEFSDVAAKNANDLKLPSFEI